MGKRIDDEDQEAYAGDPKGHFEYRDTIEPRPQNGHVFEDQERNDDTGGDFKNHGQI